MRKLTAKAMQHGALGVASALIGENSPEEFFNTICLIRDIGVLLIQCGIGAAGILRTSLRVETLSDRCRSTPAGGRSGSTPNLGSIRVGV
jgi:hypothetical protein